jgi:hypothetical protein
MKHSYKNPWHNPSYDGSRPEFTTDTEPFEYRGVQVFRYVNRFDYVFRGVAFAQRATKTQVGAEEFIDHVLSGEDVYLAPDFSERPL